MRDHSLQALIDFSAGCNFSVILVACVLLLIRRKRTRLHHLSSLFFIYLAGINFVLFFQFYIHNFFGSQLVVATNLLQATVIPFGVCLLRELTHPGRVGRRMLLFNMLSCWTMLLVYWVLKNEIIYYLFIFALLIYGIVGLSCAVFAAHRYDLKLKDWSSYTEGVDLRWLGKTVWAFLGIFAVWIIASFLNQEWVVVPYNFSICSFFAVIAYCLSRQQVVDFSKENPFDGADGQDAALADGPEKAPDAEEADEEVVPFKQALQERMVQVFETERVFLDKKLTIVRLAEIVGTNRTYLSNFINAELQCSFSDYVNGYRVSLPRPCWLRTTPRSMSLRKCLVSTVCLPSAVCLAPLKAARRGNTDGKPVAKKPTETFNHQMLSRCSKLFYSIHAGENLSNSEHLLNENT